MTARDLPERLPERLPDGRLRVLRRAEGPNGEVGDSVVEIGPEDPLFEVWGRYLTAQTEARP